MSERTVLVAGDQFITADHLAAEVTSVLGPGTTVRRYETRWPDEAFGSVDGVREASGDPVELASMMDGVQLVLTHLAPLSRRVLEAGSALQVVGVTRGGPVNVDLEAATGLGLPVVYLPGRNLSAVVEFTMGLLVGLPRSIGPASRALSQGVWDGRWFRYDLAGPELGASTLGLVGLGAVGAEVARLARAFGARVLGHDPYADPARMAELGVRLVPLPELLAESDFVSVHARLSEATRGMFDAAAFATMKPGAYFVNTARGELVDQAALLAALQDGRLAGAALDVFHPEPPSPDDPLLRRADIVATPHLAGASRQVALRSARRVAAEVAEFLQTGRLQHCANPGWADRS